MKTMLLITILSFASLFSAVTVTYPNGGETFERGGQVDITWTDGITEDVKIELYQNDVLHSDIISNTASDGTYTWYIPNEIFGLNFQIRISSVIMPALHSDISDGYFTIRDVGSLGLISPNGGESLIRGELIEIAWTDDIPEDVKIELYKSDVLFSTVIDSTESDGSFMWTVPADTYGTDYKIIITSRANGAISDISENYFEIQSGSIQLIYPNGGEIINRGVEFEISWVDDVPEGLKIELFENDIFHSTIVNSTESDGSYLWKIPDDLFGVSFKIYIISNQFASITDGCSDYFSIDKGSISISYPQAGEVIELLEKRTIAWTDNIPEEINILLYKDTEAMALLRSKSSSMEYDFFNTNIVAGSDYKIKLVSSLYSDISAETGYFTIKGTNNIIGNVSGVWTEEESPYILTGNTTVPSSNTLTIDPGVKVMGYSVGLFDVQGTVSACGDFDNKVNFKNVNIEFNSSDPDTSKLEYCDFEETRDNIMTFNKSLTGYSGKSVIQTSDGKYLVISSNANVVKADEYGNIEWVKSFPGVSFLYCISETDDNGYVAAGRSSTYECVLVKMYSDGNKQWSGYYGDGTYKDDIGYIVRQTLDSGYFITGITQAGSGGYDVLAVKTDSQGNQEWLKRFGGSSDDKGYWGQQTADGGYVITGNTKSYAGGSFYDVWLIKLDENGNQTWSKTYGGSNDDSGLSVQQTLDRGFIITGQTKSYGAGNTDIYMIKTNGLGTMEWYKTFGYSNYEVSHAVKQTSDLGYVIVGDIRVGSNTQYDIWLVKTDRYGNMQWNRTFRSASDESGYDLVQTSDGGYALTGDLNGSACLIKTDQFGNIYQGNFASFEINMNSNLQLRNSVIQNISGYGLKINNANPVIANNIMTGNNGGVILTNSSPQFVINNTIVDNDSIGIYFDSNSDPLLIDNIIYGNGTEQVYLSDDGSDPNFFYNDIQGGSAGFGLNTGVVYTGSYAGNIDANPLFVPGSYIPEETSTCVDAGYPGLTNELLQSLFLPQYDLVGNPRLYGDEIDIGCIEWSPTGIENQVVEIQDFVLYQNYPNPFNPVTTISYALPHAAQVELNVYNLNGQLVQSLVNGKKSKGVHKAEFNGADLTSGMYIYNLKVDGKTVQSKKMMLLK